MSLEFLLKKLEFHRPRFLSLASCQAASSIENCSFAGALTNRPCLSLARFG